MTTLEGLLLYLEYYINNEVLGLSGIYFTPGKGHHYPEAINIVIEPLENQPYIEEVIDEKQHYESNE